MPTIVFGTGENPIRVQRGEFYCPACQERRTYSRTEVRRSVTVLGWTVLGRRRGEYVECETCLATYRPEILSYDAGPATERVMAEYQRAVLRVLVLMVVVDGRIREPEIQTVREIYEAVCGVELTRAQVLEEAEALRRTPTTVARYVASVAPYLNDYGKEQVLRAITLVSRSDGEVHEREVGLTRRLAGVLRVGPARLEAILGG
ncbi:MAG TPA: TerB family tellurite resistance protein [Longimicrobiales bacterium]|nr:TerB family tellurite resistance protein [Longimicrobiales bacterium]